ncbi:MAG: succinylglutamate desuccinylase/aspartoacylase family protein [Alphaproteobacteria bacterium]|nr:succinylglutamate desuccinylase/aspartoacylase family protein [Alphaproteobacteria bacterium]
MLIKKSKSDFINAIKIEKGKRYRINLDMGRMHDFTDLKMPIEVVSGKKDGPTIFICSTIHGDEINGIEIVRTLLDLIDVKTMAGKLIAIPIVNIFGFNDHSRYLPDRRDLNRCFPGIKNGSLASQLAYKFMQEIVLKSDFGIDIHSGSMHRVNFPHIRIDIENQTDLELAKVFNAPAIVNSILRDGSLRNAGSQANIPIIVYEAGEILRFDQEAVEIGLRGIFNIMKKIGMISKIPSKLEFKNKNQIFLARSSSWVRASQSGIFIANVKLGDKIKKSQILGTISNPFGDNKYDIISGDDGLVIGLTMMPLVNKGDALLHLASSKKLTIKENFTNDSQNLVMD